jgi:hypothetical protein
MAATLPALVPDFIETTFANAGTVTKPPQTDPNGFVNFQDGYGADYELDLDSGNTEAKGVERADQNYLFAQSTIMAQWWQSMGLAPWYSTMANGGVAGYNAGALVGRVSATTNEWVIWRSLQDANTVDPNTSGQTAWDYVPTDSDLTTLFAMPAGGTGQKLLPGGQTTEQILTATNFNSLVTGTFEYVSDAIANGSANTPSAHAGMVECKLWTNASVTYGVQRYCDRTGSIFIRGMQNGSWTAWSSFVLTYAAIVAALGYVPANSAVTITANNGLTGGGSLAANMTIGLAPIAQSTILANPTAANGVPIACTLLNGIILNSPANTLGLGTITPVNVASQGYVSGTVGTFSTSLSALTAAFTSGGTSVGLTVTTTNAAVNTQFTDTGASGVNIKLTGNGSTTPSKTIQVLGGVFNILNNAGTAVASLTDAGVLSVSEFISSSSTAMQWTGTGTSGTAYWQGYAGAGDNIMQVQRQGSSNYLTTWYGPMAITAPGSNGLTVQTTGATYSISAVDTSGTAGIRLASGNGTTTPNKFIRSNGSNGNLEFLNSAYSAVVMSMTDTGALSLSGTITATYAILNGTNWGQLTGMGTSGSTYLWGTGGSGDNIMVITRAGSSSYNMTWNGQLSNTGTVNFNTSDETLKDNIDRSAKPEPLHRDVPFATYHRWDIDQWGRGAISQDMQKKQPLYVSPYPHTMPDGTEETKLGVGYAAAAFEQAWWCGYELDKQAEKIKSQDELIKNLLKRIEALESKQ